MVNKSKTRRGARRGARSTPSAAEPAEHEVPAVADQQDSSAKPQSPVPPVPLTAVDSPTRILEDKLVQLQEQIYDQSMRLPHDSFTQSSYESCLHRLRDKGLDVTFLPRQAHAEGQVRVTMSLPCDRFRIVKVRSVRTKQEALEAASLCNWRALQSPSLLNRALLASRYCAIG